MKNPPHRLAAELISAVPFLLGYQPTESLVLATYDMADGRITFGPALRCDFGFRAVAGITEDALLQPVCALRRVSDSTAVIPVLFSAELGDAVRRSALDDDVDDVIDHYAVPLQLICEALRCTGFDTHDPWWVSRYGYGSFAPVVRTGSVFDLDATQSVRQLSESQDTPFANFAAAAALPGCEREIEQAVSDARTGSHERSELLDAWLAEVLRYAELIESGQQHSLETIPHPEPLAVLGLEALCEEKWGRDAAQMLVSFEHSAFLPEDMARLDPGEFTSYAEAVAPLAEATAELPGLSARRPDARRTHYGILLLKMMATYVGMVHLPTVLSMIAWMEWAAGRASFAEHFARSALSIDSSCPVARLVERAVMTPTLPFWAEAGAQHHAELAAAGELTPPGESWEAEPEPAPAVSRWDDPPVLEA